jgi:hypothetical protein
MSQTTSETSELSPLEVKIGVFRGWLLKKARPFVAQNNGQMFAGWEKRLEVLLDDVRKKPRVPIALVGSTGSGKSTLLNALLGVEVLPVSNMKPCTAVVTSVRFSPAASYQAVVTFLSRAAWDDELRKLKETFRVGDQDDDTKGADEWQAIGRSTKDKICAVYGLDKDSIEEMPDLESLRLTSEIASCLAGEGQRIFLEANSSKDLKQKLRGYLSSEERYWPIIKTVDISGPFEALRHGAELIDLPGVNDPNQAREEVTRSFLRDAPFIWIAFNTKRGMTKDIHELLVRQDLLRQFLMHGKHDAVTFIGTHADDFDPEQAIEEFNLDSDVTTAEIVRERTRRVVKQVRADLEDISSELARVANAKFDELARLKSTLSETKVFVVSTRAYMQLQKISQGRKDYGIERVDDSGVPAVVRHLSDVCRKQDRRAHHEDIERRLGFVVEEVRSFFLARINQLTLQQGALKQRAEDLKNRLTGPRTTLATETEQIRDKASLRFTLRRESFESSVKIAAERAERGLEDRFDRWGSMHHMTLRACLVREGEFSSSNGNQYDFNKDIALPLLESIPFTWDDFFGQHLRESLTEVREQLKARGEVFLERLKSEAALSGVFDADRIAALANDIELSQRNIEFHVEQKTNGILNTIQRVRRELADGITNTSRKSMLSAYEAAKEESGPGMKRRMLEIITRHARQASAKLFETILTELTSGVTELALQFNHDLRELAEVVGQQADRVSGNLGLGTVQHQVESVEATRQGLDGIMGELADLQLPSGYSTPSLVVAQIPAVAPKPPRTLIYNLTGIGSNLAGFEALANLAAQALEEKTNQVEVSMSRMDGFEANMSAPLGVVLNKLTDALKLVSIVDLPPSIETVLSRNGFLAAFNYPPAGLSPSALPYQRFKLKDAALFAQYLQEHLPGKGIPIMSAGLGKLFQQSLFEVFENSAFHSDSSLGVFVCGQFFPLKQRLDITIADAGITIPRRVKATFDWDLSAPEALAWAMRDGSTTKREGKPGGVGLKLLRDFVKLNEGRLQIASGGGYWEMNGGDIFIHPLACPFPGTVVNLEVNTADNKVYSLANEVSPESVF